MSHPSKVKGTAWESAVAEYLDLERIGPVHGRHDEGDLRHPGFVIECKNEKHVDLAGYMTEVKAEKDNARKPLGVAVVKRRRGKGSTGAIGEAYVVMSLEDFRKIMGYLDG